VGRGEGERGIARGRSLTSQLLKRRRKKTRLGQPIPLNYSALEVSAALIVGPWGV
jgi:hypothetical protein